MIKFKDPEHKEFYEKWVAKTNSKGDPYRKALFYTLGLTAETRRNIGTLYNTEERCIEFDGLNMGWQTGTTTRLCRLAFNLYNGFNGDDNNADYTPYWLFDCGLMEYMFEAVRIRYQEYAGLPY